MREKCDDKFSYYHTSNAGLINERVDHKDETSYTNNTEAATQTVEEEVFTGCITTLLPDDHLSELVFRLVPCVT